jgi:hypothetical protein
MKIYFQNITNFEYLNSCKLALYKLSLYISIK